MVCNLENRLKVYHRKISAYGSMWNDQNFSSMIREKQRINFVNFSEYFKVL